MNAAAPHGNAGASPRAGLTVLLVESDPERADRIEQALDGVPGLRVVHAPTVAAARQRLDAEAVDVVLTRPDLSDGTADDLVGTMPVARAIPVIRLLDAPAGPDMSGDRIRLDTLRHPERELPFKLLEIMRAHQQEQQDRARIEELETLLRQVRTRVSAVYHEINNPLAIISGNAQLLIELARVMEIDPTLLQPIEDIEQASQRLADLLQPLAAIRDTLREHGIEPLENPRDLPE